MSQIKQKGKGHTGADTGIPSFLPPPGKPLELHFARWGESAPQKSVLCSKAWTRKGLPATLLEANNSWGRLHPCMALATLLLQGPVRGWPWFGHRPGAKVNLHQGEACAEWTTHRLAPGKQVPAPARQHGIIPGPAALWGPGFPHF